MRYALLTACALAGSCGPAADNKVESNQIAGPTRPREQAAVRGDATVLVTQAGTVCSARWNGQAVTAQGLTARGVELIGQAVAAAGDVRNLTEDSIPFVRLEAAPELAVGCIAPIVRALQRAGFARVALQPTGSAGGPRLAHLPIEEPYVPAGQPPAPLPPDAVAIGRGDRIIWRGAQVDIAVLRERVRTRSESLDEPAPPPLDPSAPPSPAASGPPGALAIAPATEATFGSVYQALQALEQAGTPAFLVLPPPN